jgi:hypothetical protein
VVAEAGLGVELREVAHGDIDSTAAARYDFSGFDGGSEIMFPARRSSRLAVSRFRSQMEDCSTREAGRYFGTPRTDRYTCLRRLANLVGIY